MVEGARELRLSCRVCGLEKSSTDFYRDASRRTGFGSRCRECVLARSKILYAQNSISKMSYSKEHHLWTTFGMTQADFDFMLWCQGDSCGICKRAPAENERRFAVDHDHRCCSGKSSCGFCIRGILCSGCNTALGWFESHIESFALWVNRKTTPVISLEHRDGSRLFSAYGVSENSYEALMSLQGRKCGICGLPGSEAPQRLSVDHDHSCCNSPAKSCGSCVRGLLCGNCNLKSGYCELYTGEMLLWRNSYVVVKCVEF